MSVLEVVALIAAGVGIGVLSALMGVGGGVLLVPLIVFVDGSQHVAEGTSLLVIAPTAVAGVIAHHRNGFVKPAAGLLLGAGGIVGAWLGARIALGIDPADLQRGFAIFLLWIGTGMTYRAWRKRREAGEATPAPPG